MTAALAAPSVSLIKERTALYRFFRKDGALLYVGVTNQLGVRWHVHTSSSDWWPAANRVTAEWLDTRALALRAEKRAIQEERPLFNVAGKAKRTSRPHQPKLPPGFTSTEAAKALGVSKATVRRYERGGALIPIRAPHSRHRRYDRACVEQLRAKLCAERAAQRVEVPAAPKEVYVPDADWMSVPEVADVFEVSDSTVRRSVSCPETANAEWGEENWRLRPLSPRPIYQLRRSAVEAKSAGANKS